jgi:hypothetical protein
VKVDETEAGIAEGLNAGSWTIGVALTGNAFGLDPAETEAPDAMDHERLGDRANSRLTGSTVLLPRSVAVPEGPHADCLQPKGRLRGRRDGFRGPAARPAAVAEVRACQRRPDRQTGFGDPVIG